MSNIQTADLAALFLKETPFIDVRAPVEFQQGSLPGAVNLPIMNNEERALVGTTYKQQGRETAIKVGHELVSGAVKEARMDSWRQQILRQPETVIYCFRGGLRSQITQRWLGEAGIDRPLIVGGYKKARQFLIDETERFSQKNSFLMLTGPTGSAKTQILRRSAEFFPAVDLEGVACHRGSAFGAWDCAQPTQRDFESILAVHLMKIRFRFPTGAVMFEDESRMIGQRTLPESVFVRMRASPVLFVTESFEQRVENIFQDYILATPLGDKNTDKALLVFARYRRATEAISQKLGGLRTQEVLQDIAVSQESYLAGRGLEANREWIRKLLSWYYDPLYAKSLEKRQPQIQFKGCSGEILEYLRNLRAGC